MPHRSTRGDNGILGPLTQALFNFAWTKLLFAKGSQLYLPDIVKNGDPARGLISYDPYVVAGKTGSLEVNIPQQTRDTACLSLQYPNIPVGVGNPTLQFMNLRITNLHAVQPDGGLSFPPGYKVRANVIFGTLEGRQLPLTIGTNDQSQYSYLFKQHCCVPTKPPEPGKDLDCQTTYVNEGDGQFTAWITKLHGLMEFTVDTSNLTVSGIDTVSVTFDPRDVTFDFNIAQSGGDLGKEALEALVRTSIQTGIATNEIQNTINSLVNDDDFKDHLKRLINEALQEAIKHPGITTPDSIRE